MGEVELFKTGRARGKRDRDLCPKCEYLCLKALPYTNEDGKELYKGTLVCLGSKKPYTNEDGKELHAWFCRALRIWIDVEPAEQSCNRFKERDWEKFERELGWRKGS